MNIKQLFSRLNTVCKKSLEEAAHLCVSSGHFFIDIPHVLTKLLLNKESDLYALCEHYGVDITRIQGELEALLQRYKKGNSATPSLSPNVLLLLERAWLVVSVDLGEEKIRSGALLYTLLDGQGLLGWCSENLTSILSVPREDFHKEWIKLLKQLPETGHKNAAGQLKGKDDNYSTTYLDKYTTNLTQKARDKKISPVWGRHKQVRQLVDVLARSRQNNPILVGEAGVGKTAIVEGLAIMAVNKELPDFLQHCEIFVLDLGLLEAGAGVQGEFEDRLKGVVGEIQNLPFESILFIDEAHTLLGGDKKNHDAANILKPALARGELRTIAATTWSEYKKYFEKDAALARRFQLVNVPEPNDDDAVKMLRAIQSYLEKKHNVVIMQDALVAAVALSRRYIGDRQLPDKAVSVLDTACARVKISQKMTPLALEEAQRHQEALVLEKKHLLSDEEKGEAVQETWASIEADIAAIDEVVQSLRQHWEKEKSLNTQLQEALKNTKDKETITSVREKLSALRENSEGMVFAWVCRDTIASIVASWTGIPVGKMLKDESKAFLSIAPTLAQSVIGQKEAIQVIADAMLTHKADLDDPDKPLGVFMLVGPSGVGKTETALALSEYFFGGVHNIITINMSEYQEAYTVSTLKGSPPGYVGYGQGGVLTEAVRRQPYSVVLLDEIEKAHPDVIEVFYQVFDKGSMEDGEGIRIDFKNTLIIMTSNAATQTIVELSKKKDRDALKIVEGIYPELQAIFKPAFLGRMCIVPYYPLTKEEVQEIALLKWAKIKKRTEKRYNISLDLHKTALDLIVSEGMHEGSGARALDAVLNRSLLPTLARFLLEKQSQGKLPDCVKVAVFNKQFIIK